MAPLVRIAAQLSLQRLEVVGGDLREALRLVHQPPRESGDWASVFLRMAEKDHPPQCGCDPASRAPGRRGLISRAELTLSTAGDDGHDP